MEVQTLVEAAKQAREHAYAPYSGFKVGAALLTAAGKVYTGCNVENASYGLAICAERVVICSAVAAGERQFLQLAIIADSPDYCPPCGACRQFIFEFGPEIEVIMANMHGQYRKMTAEELLPGAFGKKELAGSKQQA